MRRAFSFRFYPLLLAASVLCLSACETMKPKMPEMFEKAGERSKLIDGIASKYEPSSLAVGQQRDLMNRRADTLGMVTAPEMTRYLNGIRNKLVAVSGMTDVPGEVYITADPDLNAAATADGNIYINWGLLRYLRSEDEVASVLAHELSHVLLKHHDSNLLAHYQRSLQWYHGAGVMTSAAFRNMRTNSQQGLKKGETSQLQNLQLLVNLTTKVIAPSWQRTQERAADLLGVDLMVKAGYNPDGMSDLMSVLKQADDNNKKDPNPLKVADLAANVALGDNAQKMNAGIEMLAMAFGSDHPDPQARMDDVSDYLGRHYDDAATIRPYRRSSWDALLKSSSLRKTVSAYDGAVSAKQLLDRNKPREAYELSRKTVDGARNHAYPAYVHAMTLYGIGKIKEGDAALRYAFDNSTEPSGQVYAMWASALEANGRYKDALAVSEKGFERLGQAPQMVPMRVRYQRLSGDQKGAQQAASECARVHTEYRDACIREANPPAPVQKR